MALRTYINSPKWVQNLCRLMEKRGINSRSLSLRAGLNATAVRDILQGRSRCPRYSTLQALAAVLDITPAALMCEDDSVAQASSDFAVLGQHVRHLFEITAYLQNAIERNERSLALHNKCQHLQKMVPVNAGRSLLTNKEKEILTWASIGKTDSEIGEILEISDHTVNMHFRNIYKKTEVNNRIRAVIEAIAMGIINVQR